MGDFGIKITSKDADVKDAPLKDQLLNTKWPFAKLDVTNPLSFQNIRLTFNNDVPYNGDGSMRRTEIYKFRHNAVDPQGNKLVPKFWLMVKNSNTSAGAMPYFTGGGQIGAVTAFSPVVFTCQLDKDYVYFYADKWYDNMTPANTNIVGTILNIRVYLFVEDCGV